MTDIDFDELDKAVNNLMGNVTSKDSDDSPKEKNLAIGSTLKPGEKPLYDKLGEAAKNIGSETLITRGEQTFVEKLGSPLPTTELAIAELDTIQASHDVQPAQPVAPVAAVPLQTTVPRPNQGRSMDFIRSSAAARSTSSMHVGPTSRTINQDAPSPSLVVLQPAEIETTLPPDVVTIEDPNTEHTSELISEPIETPRLTPFLPDTKVEKRPLGDPAAPSTSVETSFADAASSDASKDADGDESESALEATDTSTKHDDQQILPVPADSSNMASVDQEIQVIESTEIKADVPTAESIRVVESGDTEKLSTGSIAPQYQERTSEKTDEPTGAIYDVNDYHKAIGHPAKQRSGWGVVAIIAIIIVVCAAIGAAVYFILGAGL